MEGPVQLVDNLIDLKELIETCISQKKDISSQQRDRQIYRRPACLANLSPISKNENA